MSVKGMVSGPPVKFGLIYYITHVVTYG